MSNPAKTGKKASLHSSTIGRFATLEEAARAKNAQLLARIKKIGLKVVKSDPSK